MEPTQQIQIPPREDEEVTLLDLAAVPLRRWKVVLVAVAASLLVAAVVASVQPDRYTTRTVLVPSSTQSGSRAQLMAQQLQLPMLAGLGGSDSDRSLVEAILGSRSLKDSVASRVAGTEDPRLERDVQRILDESTTITSQLSDRSILVEVTAEDPRMAARIGAEFPSAINDIATRISVDAALQKRATLEKQLAHAREDLIESEQRLLVFQQQQGTSDVEEQARRTVETAAELQRGIIEAELNVARLRRSATPDNPQLQAAVAELGARRAQLDRLSAGRERSSIFLGQSEVPELKVALSRLLRDFLKNEQVYLSLTAALAEAQVNANEDLAVVSVLDPAFVPLVPSGPKVPLILAVGLFAGLVFGLFAAFVSEYLHRARAVPGGEAFFAAWDQLRTDVTRHLPGRRRAVGHRPGQR